jgi:hypothetical protein
MRLLWPDLKSIQQTLSTKPTVSMDEEIEFSSESVEFAPQAMPTALSELIDRTVSAQTLGKCSPNAGDIVFLEQKSGLSIAFCLEAKGSKNDAGTFWRGWLVSPEVDYATDRDVVVEPDDGPTDPLAGMVQTWNPLTLMVPTTTRILARLSTYRLNLIKEVAGEPNSGEEWLATPGKIALRPTSSGRIVLTGSPLGNEDDPRHEYQDLYATLAKRLVPSHSIEQERAQPPEPNIFLRLTSWIQGHRLGSGMAVAASVLCGTVIFKVIMAEDPNSSQIGQIAQTEAPKKSALSPELSAPKSVEDKQVTPLVIEPPPVKETPPTKRNEPKLKPKETKQETQLAHGNIDDILQAKNLLIPLNDQTMVLAMRSGTNDKDGVHVFRIYLKSISDLDRAIEQLNSLGFTVIQIENQTKSLQVSITPSKVNQSILVKLNTSGIFTLPTER